MVWLLGRYSDSYASNQYRAFQQFFRWWSDEEELPDPMARLHPPRVGEKARSGLHQRRTSEIGAGLPRPDVRAAS